MSIDLAVFRKNYLVVGLPEEEVARVAELAEFCIAYPGRALIEQGAANADLLIILDGVVEVHSRTGTLLGERGPCSVIGEIALVDNQPRSASVTAKGTVSYALLKAEALRRFMGQNPKIGLLMLSNLARVLAMRLREASSTIEDLDGKVGDPWRFDR
ncbi:MAG TPA: cyclic nucleotide-binding domain-containing protein [Fimbriimonas sp.]|nr:cyclic nucleotide-binding domain-containing protein [Fimbriimonas sp.]